MKQRLNKLIKKLNNSMFDVAAAPMFIVMFGVPILLVLILGISVYALFLRHTDADGTVRTGLEGFKVYLIPNFSGMTLKQFLVVLTDAMGQLFYSISVAMGIMITWDSS